MMDVILKKRRNVHSFSFTQERGGFMISRLSDLIIGTAQFGLDYGITNLNGRTSKEEVKKILQYCRNNNIHILDAAADYGKSEQVLGEIITDNYFTIYSKTPHIFVESIKNVDLQQIKASFYQSLKKLKVNQIEGIFVHNVQNLIVANGDKLFRLLQGWKEEGLIKKIGVSIYDEDMVSTLLENYDLDVFQIPINLYDQRLLHSGTLRKIKDKDIEIHARSIFLQGILLADEHMLTKKFHRYIPYNQKLKAFLDKYQMTKLDGALKFVSQIDEIDHILVGINHLQQLEEIVASFEALDDRKILFDSFQLSDIDLIDPRRW